MEDPRRAKKGAGDKVIMSIAGHVSRAMLSHSSHVRMEAKRRALEEGLHRPVVDETGLTGFYDFQVGADLLHLRV